MVEVKKLDRYQIMYGTIHYGKQILTLRPDTKSKLYKVITLSVFY